MKKCGVVTVVFETKVSAGTKYTKVGTMPEGWRPHGYIVQPAYFSVPSSSIPYCDVRYDGTVAISPLGSSGDLYCAITYVVAG